MGEVVPFPRGPETSSGNSSAAQRPPATVFENQGWRIMKYPSAGQYMAVSTYCRTGVEVGRFSPEAESDDHHGTDIAILTRCGRDERLSRCAIGWLNAGGPHTAILGPTVVTAGGRYHYWRDVIIEVAAIGGMRLARLIDGSIAIADRSEPVPLLDPFAALPEHRRRRAFSVLPREVQSALLHWADPAAQFGSRLRPSQPH